MILGVKISQMFFFSFFFLMLYLFLISLPLPHLSTFKWCLSTSMFFLFFFQLFCFQRSYRTPSPLPSLPPSWNCTKETDRVRQPSVCQWSCKRWCMWNCYFFFFSVECEKWRVYYYWFLFSVSSSFSSSSFFERLFLFYSLACLPSFTSYYGVFSSPLSVLSPCGKGIIEEGKQVGRTRVGEGRGRIRERGKEGRRTNGKGWKKYKRWQYDVGGKGEIKGEG